MNNPSMPTPRFAILSTNALVGLGLKSVEHERPVFYEDAQGEWNSD